MHLSSELVAAYDRDGYLLVPEVFSTQEVGLMLRDVESGGRVASNTKGSEDTSGKKAKLAIWHQLGDDIWAAASTHPALVNTVRILMHEDVAFFHGKVMLKEAGSGGAWEWHQDYGYWYDQGFVFPRMMSAFVALDKATIENGCLQVLKGSHKLGRLSHGRVGEQTGADPERIPLLEPLFERVHCEMEPGSVLFFDSNLLHTSAPNESAHHRRSFIVCYNALTNPQLRRQVVATIPCPVGLPNGILEFGEQN